MEGNQLRDFILKYGLIVGFAQVAILLFTYILGIEYLTSYWVLFLTFVIVVGITIYAGIKWKRLQDGYITFQKAFIIIFFVYALSGFISTLFNITLYNVIDPELPVKIQEAVIDKTMTMMDNFGASEEDMEKTLNQLENMETQYSAAALFSGYVWSLIFGAIIAAITGAVIKKDKPIFEDDETLDA